MNSKAWVFAGIFLVVGVTVGQGAEFSATFRQKSATSFSRPHDLVLSPDGKFLYVADVGNDAVKVLDPLTLKTLGAIGASELDSPHDLAFDRRGRLLVADTGNDRIAIYTVSGTEGKLVGELRGGLGSPEGVDEGPNGTIYVTNASRHTVVAFAKNRKVMTTGSRGGGAGEFVRPHDIEVDARGRLFVADPGNNRIQILDGEGKPLRSLGGADYAFNEPKYLALDERGWLFVADEYNRVLKVFDPKFRQVGVIRGSEGSGPLGRIEGVEVAGGLIWISDTGNNRILLFRIRN